MATPGLEVSVSMVHALIRQAEAHGFPPSRIMLGGMSQGGVLSMAAGFSYEKPLAGIIAISSWVPPCLPGAMRQPHTPLMMANGDRDDVVPMNMFQKSVESLEQAGCSQIAKKVYPGLGHVWQDFECNDVKQNILSAMPEIHLTARSFSTPEMHVTARNFSTLCATWSQMIDFALCGAASDELAERETEIAILL
mmetsp:Transcript_115665/g.180734  ORF Transcript_115665/g.180734 Transcript_115665/m.180734 type:complete len:194 (+) Transcript_115665:1-582(+)